MNVLLLVLSSRTKRSEVKDLVFIHVDVLETLHYVLSDNWVPLQKGDLSICINLSKSALRGLLFPSDIAKLGTKKADEEYSSIGVKYLKVLRKVLAFRTDC